MAIPDEQAHAVVQQALDLGLNLFDTAPLYGSGKSEQRIGHVLCQIPRDSFVLCPRLDAYSTRWNQVLRCTPIDVALHIICHRVHR